MRDARADAVIVAVAEPALETPPGSVSEGVTRDDADTVELGDVESEGLPDGERVAAADVEVDAEGAGVCDSSALCDGDPLREGLPEFDADAESESVTRGDDETLADCEVEGDGEPVCDCVSAYTVVDAVDEGETRGEPETRCEARPEPLTAGETRPVRDAALTGVAVSTAVGRATRDTWTSLECADVREGVFEACAEAVPSVVATSDGDPLSDGVGSLERDPVGVASDDALAIDGDAAVVPVGQSAVDDALAASVSEAEKSADIESDAVESGVDSSSAVGDADGVPASVPPADALAVPVPRAERDGVGAALCVRDWRALRLADGDAVCERVPRALRVVVGDAVCERVTGALRVDVGEADGERVARPLRVPVRVDVADAVAVAEADADADGEGEADPELVAGEDADGCRDGVAALLPVGVRELDAERVSVAHAVGDRESNDTDFLAVDVDDFEDDGDALAVLEARRELWEGKGMGRAGVRNAE